MLNLGMVRPGTTIFIPFDTFDGGTGASITMTGLAVTDVEIYKDGGVTQRASDSGYTLLDTDGIDFDGITGIHGLSIALSDNATAGFYSAGSKYFIVISSITVDAQTVNFIAAYFTIGYPDAVINTTIATLASQTSFTLTDGPAEDDALNEQWAVIHDVASAVQLGKAIISDYTGSTKTVTLAAGTTFTAAATDNISIMGPMPIQPTVAARKLDVSTGGEAGIDWANVGSPTTALNLSATNIDVDQVVASVSGAVGSVTAVSSGAITEASFATTAGSFKPLGIIDQGTAQSATGTTLVLRSAAAFADDEIIGSTILITGGSAGVGQSRVITDYVSSTDTATVATWTTTPTGTITYVIFGTPVSSGGSGLDAAATRAALGLASANLDTQLDALPTNSELATALGTADDATLAAIAALNNLSQANVRTAIGLASANLDTQLDALPTNAELATALGTADDAVLAAVATVDTVVDSIKAKTDSLTFTQAGHVDANIQRINDVTITGNGQTGTEFNV